ncbi:hypothetical protein ACWC5I_11915 [Kitasatospora sp. NPDC001574]
MPAKTLVQNEQEAIDWLTEHDYKWMVEKYREKYNIETTVSMWASFRSRRQLPRKIARSAELLPWTVKEEHRWAYPAVMLRFESRLREGRALKDVDRSRLESWKRTLSEQNLVVHYVPDTADGFFYVPREDGDKDLVRTPSAPVAGGQAPAVETTTGT